VAAVAEAGAAAVVMSYWNPIDHYGIERFAADLGGLLSIGDAEPDTDREAARRRGLGRPAVARAAPWSRVPGHTHRRCA